MKKALNIVYLSIGLTVFMYILLFLSPFENAIYLIDSGAYDYSIRSSKGYSAESNYYENKIEEIVIIDIDERSLAKNRLGRFASWPHHEYYAEVVKNISRDNPKVIAFDIIIDEDKDSEKNRVLNEAIKNSGKVVSALYFENENPDKYIDKDLEPPKGYQYEKDSFTIPEFEISPVHKYDHLSNPNIDLYNNSLGTGAVLFTPDDDGVIRRLVPFYEYLDRFYPFLGIQMFAKANGVNSFTMIGNDTLIMRKDEDIVRTIPLKDGNIFISYTGEIDKFRRISFYSVLRNDNYQQLEPGFFKDKYVIIGASAAGLFDLRVTPVQETFPGVGIHANILHTILAQNYLEKLGKWELTLVLFLCILLSALVVAFRKAIFIIVSLTLFIFAIFIAALIIHENSNYWIQIVPIIASIILTIIATYAYKYATEEKDKKMIRSAFSQFVNKNVVDDLLADPTKLKLGGEKKNCSVFFSDVAGFTTISEKLDPEKLVKLLNIYLTDMTNLIFDNNGMIDKYIGDAIMAVFGAPVSTGNHAVQACKAAIDQQNRITTLQKELLDQGYPLVMARMGINSGEMVVGNMGSEDYFNYTVMGDTVNLAARLEPANKEYDTLIMIGHNTYQMAIDHIHARQLDFMVVKGKTEPVAVYELFGLKEYEISSIDTELLETYNEGYQLYLNRNWDMALNKFKYCLNLKNDDGPSKVYVDRTQYYMENEPEEDWAGVYVMTHK